MKRAAPGRALSTEASDRLVSGGEVGIPTLYTTLLRLVYKRKNKEENEMTTNMLSGTDGVLNTNVIKPSFKMSTKDIFRHTPS